MTRSSLAAAFIPATGFEPRRNARPVDLLLLHYTGMATAEAALERLCSPHSGVSCHYLVDELGRIVQMVDEDMRAWHAGVSCWQGESDTNSRSIGIEIQNRGHWIGYDDFPAAQMEAVEALCLDILSRHAIPACNVLAHSDVAPGRKIDPGEKFDWKRLHAAGVGHWVPEVAEGLGEVLAGDDLIRFQRLLADYGYRIAVTGEADKMTASVTDAFQRHFRPSRVDGVPDRSCLLTLEALLQGLRQRAISPAKSAS